MKIYLDRNVYEDMRQDRNGSASFIARFNSIKEEGSTILASVIHAEEIATPYVSGGDTSYIEKEISFIDQITDCNIIFPSDIGFFVLPKSMKEVVDVVENDVKETKDALQNDVNKQLHQQAEFFFSRRTYRK